jgi:replicative DNA helicase
MNAHAFSVASSPFLDRITEQDVTDAIETVLACVIADNSMLDGCGLEPDDFDVDLHRTIFAKIVELSSGGVDANSISLKPFVPKDIRGLKISPAEYLTRLAVYGGSPIAKAQFAAKVQIIKAASMTREVRREGEFAVQLADEGHSLVTILDEAEKIEARLKERRERFSGVKDISDDQVVDQYLQMITGSYEHADCEGVPVEFLEIQRVLSDTMLRRGRMYGLLSSSGEGKSSLMLQIAHTALMAGHPVLILSFDQSELECLAQMAAQNVGVEFRSQMQNTPNKPMLSQGQIDTAYGFVRKIKRLPFSVKDCETRDTAEKLETYIDQFLKRKANGRTPLIIVDHIRAIKPEGPADEGTKALLIAQKLKSTFKKRNAAGLIIQQRSGSGMKRDNPRPIADDLYGGEAARQPFDTIFYLYRAEMHMNRQIATAKDAQEQDRIRSRFRHAFGEELEGKAEIGAIKARFSNPNTRGILDFDAPYTKYTSRRQAERELF